MTTNEQKADVVLCNETGLSSPYRALAVKNLSAAGLIVTNLHERALAFVEKMHSSPLITGEQWNDCHAIGRESLAAKKPKERWAVRRTAVGNHWEVWERKETHEGAQYEVRAAVFECDSDGSEARAYVARKNAEGK